MAATSPKKVQRPPVHYCWNCGTRLPSPWQGRTAMTTAVVVLLLLAGAVAGWRLTRSQVVQEAQLHQEQTRLREAQHTLQTEQQWLEEAQRQLAAERQWLETERQKLAAVGEAPNPAEENPVPPTPVREKPGPPPTEKSWTNSLGMAFVLIPAGTFQMGSKDANAYDDEKPVHQVSISIPFYLGKYEVTQAQWQAVMGNNPSQFKGETLPVENVSWDQVQEFVRQLNTREPGTKYRLPTEAEWEYAARAGTTTAYSFGNDERQLGDYAWYSANAGNTTHAVGQKQPNPWDLYDMHGNVWEWVQDWYGPYTAGNAVDPAGPLSGLFRVGRGGGWNGDAGICRSAYRYDIAPGIRHALFGFRLLREVQ